MSPEHAAKLLAMLTAKTQRLEPAIASFQALRRDDVVLALSYVNSVPARMLARIKYSDDVSNIDNFTSELCAAIERGLLSHIVEFGAPQRWKIPRKNFLRDLCRLAVVECLSPNLCWECAGHGGAILIDGSYKPCDGCQKKGVRPPTEQMRAQLLQIGEDAWRKSWKERYHIIQKQIDKYEAIALGGMSKRISG